MRPFTPKEKQFIIDHLSDMNYPEIAKSLNRSEDVVKWKSRAMGLVKPYTRKTKLSYEYSESEDDYIRMNYNSLSYTEMGAYLNRSLYSVKSRLKRLGLKKTCRGKVRYLNNPWKNPTVKMAKAHIALKSKLLKPEDIPDQLAELKALQIKLQNEFK